VDPEPYIDLVDRVIGQFRVPSAITRSELFGYGYVGLTKAAQTFDPSKGVPFEAHARLSIHRAVLEGIRTLAPIPRRAHQAGYQLIFQPTPSTTDESIDLQDPSLIIEQQVLEGSARQALEQLPDRERWLLDQHFFQERTLRSLSQELGVSEGRTCAIKHEALRRLRKVLKDWE
jgi:RNA polymerase sigma factor for flagellar operon FliA